MFASLLATEKTQTTHAWFRVGGMVALNSVTLSTSHIKNYFPSYLTRKYSGAACARTISQQKRFGNTRQ